MLNEKITSMSIDELRDILSCSEDYELDVIEEVKMLIEKKSSEESLKNKNTLETLDEILLAVLDEKKKSNYYLKIIAKNIKGISVIVWIYLICSVLVGIFSLSKL